MRAMAEAAKSLGILFSFALTMGASAALAEGAGGPCTGPAANEAARQPAPMNLKEAATATGVLARMMEATKLAGLDDPEIEVGPLTLLAPSDDAFNALPQEVRDRLLAPENRAILTDLLLYHAIPGLYPTERLLNARVRNYTIQAIDGSAVEINKRRKTAEIDIAGARIVRSDVMATDGIIHVIDKVLMPPAILHALMNPPDPTAEIIAEGDQ
jgi:uncharacterized surface protein with fasciclin (FAS1) repeats